MATKDAQAKGEWRKVTIRRKPTSAERMVSGADYSIEEVEIRVPDEKEDNE